MTNSSKKNTSKSPQAQGIEAGLKIALFFAISFYWVGYHPWLSIFFAIIAGVSGGCIVCWWQITDEPEPKPPQVKKKTLEYQTKISNTNREKTGLMRKENNLTKEN